jgi:hypothetical protein
MKVIRTDNFGRELPEKVVASGLIQPGDWRVVYNDGARSRWMSHGDAENYATCFGGKVEWRHDSSA